jgi:ATP-dependent DNA helicase DinG
MSGIYGKFAVFDFETTGPEPRDRIIQVGVAVVENGTIIQTYASFVKPGIPIPPEITRLTGITEDDVAEAPPLEDVLMDLLPILDGASFVAHNAPFDLGVLQRALSECGYEPFNGRVYDTLAALRFLYPGLAGLSLGKVARTFGIGLDRHHQADHDAAATAELWILCLERLASLSIVTLRRLRDVFASSPAWDDFVFLLDELLGHKEADALLPADGEGVFRGFRMKAGEWTDVGEKPEPEDEAVVNGHFAVFYEKLKERLKRRFSAYEERDAQERMIFEVADAFGAGSHLMVEAGTGTGKSLAYLIPALFHSLSSGEKVVVSTHTINLQEQIRTRDIPLLEDLLPVPFRAALLKGRNHYLCLRKFEQKVNALDFENPKQDPLTAAQLIVWLEETERGDEEELQFGDKGREFWRSVQSDSESCLNRACPWFRRCFYHRAKHEAGTADLVITNHSMLFTDVKAEHRLLPPYRYLVIDEAHQLEEAASRHLGTELGYFNLVRVLQELYKDAHTGLLPRLAFRLGQDNGDGDWDDEISALEASFDEIVSIKEEWDRFSEKCYGMITEQAASAQQNDGSAVLRLKADKPPRDYGEVKAMEHNLHVRITTLVQAIETRLPAIRDVYDESPVSGLVTDLSGALKELIRFRDALRFILEAKDASHVFWMEAAGHYRHRSMRWNAAPVDVSEPLHDHFFGKKDSVVLTSATLAVGHSFDYVSRQLGLEPAAEAGRLKTLQLPSVFDYRKQALVLIPRDFPSVRGAHDAAFVRALADSLTRVALRTKGRMLILFTSHRMLKQAYAYMQEPLAEHGVTLLGQGMDGTSRNKLLRLFQDQGTTVLLGTSSFWEGVDIPGEALSCLAIVRLPFQPPNHPVVEARTEAARERKENPFLKLSVPSAVIRFKQGFGRLVRTATDRGIVIVYDTRIIDTSYGKYFLQSLPGPTIEQVPAAQLPARVEDWLNRGNPS